VHPFNSPGEIRLFPAASGSDIRYTLDGSEPDEHATLYTGPVSIDTTTIFKARTFKDFWPFGSDRSSETLTVKFERLEPVPAIGVVGQLLPGLDVAVYELRQTIFDQNGVFTGRKNMLPNLDGARPLAVGAVGGLVVPDAAPSSSIHEMKKGYYRYSGFYRAPHEGVFGFRLFSPGPVVLRIDDWSVIEVTGSYGLSQQERFGEVVLAEGLHEFELIVTDPVFWKGKMEEPMKLELSVMLPGSRVYRPLGAESLMRARSDARLLDRIEKGPSITSVDVNRLVAGLIESRYNWGLWIQSLRSEETGFNIPANGLPESYLVPLGEALPYMRRTVRTPNGNDSLMRLVEYSGFFKVRIEGDYEFRLDGRGANELRLGGVAVSRNRIMGPPLTGRVNLKPGMVPLSLRLAFGKGTLEVRLPGHDEFEPVQTGDLWRLKTFEPVDSDLLIASVACDEIGEDGDTPVASDTATAVAIDAQLIDGVHGKALRLGGEAGRLEVRGLSLPDDACTVAFWCRRGKTGESVAVEGLNRRFLVRFRGTGDVLAGYYRNPKDEVRINGGQAIEDGDWFHFAVSFGAEVRVYVNGELLGSRQVMKSHQYTADVDARATMLNLLVGEQGAIDEVKVWNEVLPPALVKREFQAR
jgi:hypothetical protein